MQHVRARALKNCRAHELQLSIELRKLVSPLQLNGRDLRREPIEARREELATLIRKAGAGIQLSEHIEHDAAIVFEHACKLGLEGIVSKRRGSRYISARSPDWIKLKNPNSPAVLRETEEDWGR